MALEKKDTDRLKEIADARGINLTEYKDELLAQQATGLRAQKVNEWWTQLTLEQREEVMTEADLS